MQHATTTAHASFNTAAGICLPSDSAHAVHELDGFKKGDRVAVTDVVARPPQVYCGEIASVFSDGLAHVVFDHALSPAAEQNVKNNGRVNLHWAIHG